MKSLTWILSLMSVFSMSFANADSVFEQGASRGAWVASDLVDPEGNSLQTMHVNVTAIEEDGSGQYIATANSVATDENGAPLCAGIRLSLEASSISIASLSAGVLIGRSVTNECPKGVLAFGMKGLEIRGEIGVTGFGGAVGYGVALASEPGYSGLGAYFVGMGMYHPTRSPGAFMGGNGSTYVGPVADVYLIGLKLGLGYLFKMPGGPGGGADFMFRLNLGIGI